MTKKKYTNLYTEDSKAVILPGRHPCECQAYKHKLINNCLKCGRIICEQEGSGPCYFCGNLVCTKEEEEIINRGSKKSDILLNKLMTQTCISDNENLQKAVHHKDKLLNYDKTSAKRTMVIDDQSDYFLLEQNNWLSPQQRKLMQEKETKIQESKYCSKFNQPRSFTLDFEQKAIIEDSNNNYLREVEAYKKLLEEASNSSLPSSKIFKEPHLEQDTIELPDPRTSGVDPRILDHFAIPKLVDTPNVAENAFRSPKEGPFDRSDSKVPRIQDDDFQASFDHKKCLSMHQPYASLLIYGIKKEEGRDWYTPHRGRLWIASTAKKFEPSEIKEVQTFYEKRYQDTLGKAKSLELRYPQTYPTSCLLGCVTIDDCLTQEEFRSRFPGGVSLSPFVWLCSDPKKLKFNIPIQGHPKIYPLDNQIWRAATKNLIE